MRGAAALLTALLPLLASCALPPDPDRLRVCRTALPALQPAASRIALLRSGAGPDRDTVRLDYRVLREGEPARTRLALCRFAPGSRADLVDLRTERGPISGASLYLLKTYYLDSPEGIAAEPPPEDRTADLPAIPRPLAVAAEAALAALPTLAVTALLAAAYALVHGLVGRINLVFGALAALGGVATGLGFAWLSASGDLAGGTGLVAAALLASASTAAWSLAAGSATFLAVPARNGQASLIATVGAALALSEGLRLAAGPAPRWIPPVWTGGVPVARAGEFVLTVVPSSLATGGAGLAAALGLAALMRWSGWGRAWRAAAQDPLAAALFGISRTRLLLQTLALAGAAAGLAGALVAIRFGALGFADGLPLGLKALAGAILGGIGSVPGALAGGLAIAAFEAVWSALLPIEGRDMALFVALVFAVILRPEGLFGRRDAA